MALKQSNSATVWTEPKGSGAAIPIALAHLVSNGHGGYRFEDVSVGNPTAARMLASGLAFVVTPGSGNPSALAEARAIDLGVRFRLYR